MPTQSGKYQLASHAPIAPAPAGALHGWIMDAGVLKLLLFPEQVCDPLVKGCRMGPVASAQQYNKVLAYVQSALDEGASTLTGGRWGWLHGHTI